MKTRLGGLVGGLLLASSPSLALPAGADVQGTWRVERVVGADQGGAGADGRSLLGKVVKWTATDVRMPGRTCRLKDPKVAEVPNATLAFDWGGETIDDLSLSRSDKARAFGAGSTPVYGSATCGNGVLIDKDRLLMMLDNGFIYVLGRTKPG